jgi:hypothetical protein
VKKCIVTCIALCSTVACAKQIGLAGTTPSIFKNRPAHHTHAPAHTTPAQPTAQAQPAESNNPIMIQPSGPFPAYPAQPPANPTANVDTTTAEDKQTTQIAVTNLLAMAADVANIVHNPHNPQAVIQNAQGILNSILNIVAAAVHRSGAKIDQATFIALLACIDKELHDLVVTQKRALGMGTEK